HRRHTHRAHLLRTRLLRRPFRRCAASRRPQRAPRARRSCHRTARPVAAALHTVDSSSPPPFTGLHGYYREVNGAHGAPKVTAPHVTTCTTCTPWPISRDLCDSAAVVRMRHA